MGRRKGVEGPLRGLYWRKSIVREVRNQGRKGGDDVNGFSELGISGEGGIGGRRREGRKGLWVWEDIAGRGKVGKGWNGGGEGEERMLVRRKGGNRGAFGMEEGRNGNLGAITDKKGGSGGCYYWRELEEGRDRDKGVGGINRGMEGVGWGEWRILGVNGGGELMGFPMGNGWGNRMGNQLELGKKMERVGSGRNKEGWKGVEVGDGFGRMGGDILVGEVIRRHRKLEGDMGTDGRRGVGSGEGRDGLALGGFGIAIGGKVGRGRGLVLGEDWVDGGPGRLWRGSGVGGGEDGGLEGGMGGGREEGGVYHLGAWIIGNRDITDGLGWLRKGREGGGEGEDRREGGKGVAEGSGLGAGGCGYVGGWSGRGGRGRSGGKGCGGDSGKERMPVEDYGREGRGVGNRGETGRGMGGSGIEEWLGGGGRRGGEGRVEVRYRGGVDDAKVGMGLGMLKPGYGGVGNGWGDYGDWGGFRKAYRKVMVVGVGGRGGIIGEK
ncbi:hypothetical protein Tco_1043263 [Tanacetum coccineum]|uniref:Uncharacterized protein n=1 Tax=Tanacetum coccineum TaxID=301880 RepID=A0ABQ5GP50_9ASTR